MDPVIGIGIGMTREMTGITTISAMASRASHETTCREALRRNTRITGSWMHAQWVNLA
ncbi:hypothetical protein [Dyella sp. S184]|uniref:hypothetical protein n=1 Tax=Dyella sp. S184 TaxID=1641862 RepID=UPI0020B12F60|nr:hypothetical protein [Dyella sp. S184]